MRDEKKINQKKQKENSKEKTPAKTSKKNKIAKEEIKSKEEKIKKESSSQKSKENVVNETIDKKTKNKQKDSLPLKKDKKKNILTKTMSIPITAIKNKIDNSSSNKNVSEAVKLYKKKKEKKERQKRRFNGHISFDVFNLIVLIITVAFVSSALTCIISNYQFKKGMNLINKNVVADKNVQDFLNTYSEILDNFYEEIDKEGMMAAAMSGMLSYLEDNYSIYLNENDSENLSESLDGSYNGLGIVVRGTVVEEIYKNSPAEEAGFEIGDDIIEVNGNEVSMDNYSELSNFLDLESENKIVVKRKDEKITFKLKTGNIHIPATTSDVIKSPDKKKNIGYIKLKTFSLLAYEDFKESLTDLEEKKIDSLIIDLRNNTGGYLNVATNVSSLFLEKDKVIYSLENKNKITTYKDETSEKRDYKIVVLVNGGTASASEILATALHDSYGATIVGNKTFGKGKVQTMKYYEGSIVKYTSAKWLRPNGECIDEVGIEPDYEVSLTIENDEVYDKQLDKAIELLSK